MSSTKINSEQGFTIIELLIAAAVFSVVLIILALGISQISDTYYKGVTATNTQNVARSIMNNISQAIQLSGGLIDNSPGNGAGQTYGFCIGNQEIDYVLGYEVEGNTTKSGTRTFPSNHGLVTTNNVPSCPSLDCATNPNAQCYSNPDLINNSSLAVASQELMSKNMRLSELSVCFLAPNGQCSSSSNLGSGDLYRITVQVTYGDDDLICNPQAVPGSCSNASLIMPAQDYVVNPTISGDQVECKGTAGQQFCATSLLTSTVEKRLP